MGNVSGHDRRASSTSDARCFIQSSFSFPACAAAGTGLLPKATFVGFTADGLADSELANRDRSDSGLTATTSYPASEAGSAMTDDIPTGSGGCAGACTHPALTGSPVVKKPPQGRLHLSSACCLQQAHALTSSAAARMQSAGSVQDSQPYRTSHWRPDLDIQRDVDAEFSAWNHRQPTRHPLDLCPWLQAS